MASRISRREWVRGLPSASGVGKYDRKRAHSASERSIGYVFLIEESVRNHPNPHPYQTGSKVLQQIKILFLRDPDVDEEVFLLKLTYYGIKRQEFVDHCRKVIVTRISIVTTNR